MDIRTFPKRYTNISGIDDDVQLLTITCYLYVIPNVNMLLTQKSSKERGMEPKRANSLSLWEKQAPNLSIINCIRIVILRASVGHDDHWDFWSTD